MRRNPLIRADRAALRAATAGAHAHPAARRLVGGLARWLAAAEVGLLMGLAATGAWRAAPRVLASVGAVYTVTEAAGLVWRRARPFQQDSTIRVLVRHGGARSFPSRHVAAAVAMAEVARPSHPAIGTWMRLVAGLLAISRVAAGLHYPSDAMGGVVLGIAIGRLLR